MNLVTINLGNPKMILCPCLDCRNVDNQCGSIVVEHLVIKIMEPKYKHGQDWYAHGEIITSGETVDDIVNDETYNLYKAAHFLDRDYVNPNQNYTESFECINDDDFMAKLTDAETSLYNGSRQNKLLAILSLFCLKTRNGWSDKSFDEF